MPVHPPFRKVFPLVASREAMFALINRHKHAPFNEVRVNGTLYAGSWFEVDEAQYEEMLNVMPPLFLRPDMFAMSEFNGGKVAMVFVIVAIAAVRRRFLGFCDLAIPNSPEMLRDAIVTRETGPRPERLTREEKLEAIWNATSWTCKGYTAQGDQQNGEARYLDKRMFVDPAGTRWFTVRRLLDYLSDEQIDRMLPGDTTYLAEIGGSGANARHPDATEPDTNLPPKADGNV